MDELPGCAVRGSDRDQVLDELRSEIPRFLRWAELAQPSKVEVNVSDEVESAIETDEDTEVLVERDRAPLTADDWEQMQAWLDRSRGELQALLREADLNAQRPGTERTAREEIEHVGFVELMYAMWTFDLQSRDGLARFLDWTRDAAVARMTDLADRGTALRRGQSGQEPRGPSLGRHARPPGDSSGTSCSICERLPAAVPQALREVPRPDHTRV